MPKLSVDPRDPGDDSVGFDGAKNRSGLGIELDDLLGIGWPTHSDPSAHARPESSSTLGVGIVESTRPLFGSIFWMRPFAIW